MDRKFSFNAVVSPSRSLKTLAVISSFGMFLINLVGFLDTQTNSALGCGKDWPLCNGQAIPNLNNLHVIIEFSHRLIVGVFALIAVIFSIWAWRKYHQWKEVWVMAFLSIGFIVIQSGLGALAVVFVNPPAVLALHLGFGLLAMIGVWLQTIFLWQLSSASRGQTSGLTLRKKVVPSALRWTWAVWIYTYLAMYFGSYVAFRDAGAACLTWPLCNGKVFPGFSGPLGLDFIHRLIAVGLVVLVSVLLWKLRGSRRERPDIYRGYQFLWVFVMTQVLTGANLALSHLQTGPYMLHISNLMILFGILSYLAMQVYPYIGPRSQQKKRISDTANSAP